MTSTWDITPAEKSWYDYDQRLNDYNKKKFDEIISSQMMCVNVKGVCVYGYFATYKVRRTNLKFGKVVKVCVPKQQKIMKKRVSRVAFEDIKNNQRSIGDYQMFKNVTEMPSKINDALASVKNLADTTATLTPELLKSMETLQGTFASDGNTIKKFNEALDSIKKVGSNLDSIQTLLDKLNTPNGENTISFTSILDKIKNHPIGMMSNLISLARSHDLTDFVTNFITLLSQLGFEAPVLEAIRERWNSFKNTSTNQYESLQDKLPKLISLIITLLGPLLVGTNITDFTNFIRRSKKDAATMKEVIEELEDLAEEYGFGWSARSKFVKNLKTDFEDLIKSLAKFDMYLSTSPIRFCRKTEYDEFVKVGQKITEAVKNLATKSYSDMIGTSMAAEIRNLHTRYNKMATDVARIRRTNADRVKPVGVCIYGHESQIGKSNIMTQLEKRIKLEIRRRINLDPSSELNQDFEDIEMWETWNQNIRDKYDQNFQGQQFHCIDDAFSNKEEVEHSALINFISNRPVPSYQAELNSKGFAYEVKVVMVSCNTFPVDSKTINNIHALAERFPVFIHAQKKANAVVPDGAINFPDFPWLDLHLTTGSDYFNKKGGLCKDQGCYNGNTTNLDLITKLIVDKMYVNQTRFNVVQAAMKIDVPKILNKEKIHFDANTNKVSFGVYENEDDESEDEFVEAVSDLVPYAGKTNPNYKLPTPIDVKQDIPKPMNRLRLYPNVQEYILKNKDTIPHYRNEFDLPSEVMRALRTSTTKTKFITTSLGARPDGNTLQDLINENRLAPHEFIFYYYHYNFQCLPKWQTTLDAFFNDPAFFGKDDEHFIWDHAVYFNDVFSYVDINPHEADYFSLVCPTLDSFTKLFTDPEFIGLGVVFTTLNFIGIPMALSVVITHQLAAHLGQSWYMYKKGQHIDAGHPQEKVNFYVSIFSKFITVIGLWIIGKILLYIAKTCKNFLSHCFWDNNKESKSKVVAFFESDGIEYRHLNLKITPVDTTCILVKEDGKNRNMFKLFDPSPVLLGSVTLSKPRGIQVAKLCCLDKNDKIVPSAFINCLNNLSVPIAHFSSEQLDENSIVLLKENGLFKKIICYTKSRFSTDAYNPGSRPINQRSVIASFEFNQVPEINKLKFLKMYDDEHKGDINIVSFAYTLDALNDKIRNLNRVLKQVPTKPFSAYGASVPANLIKGTLESSLPLHDKLDKVTMHIENLNNKYTLNPHSINEDLPHIGETLSDINVFVRYESALEDKIRLKYNIVGPIDPFLYKLEKTFAEVEAEGILEESPPQHRNQKQKATVRIYEESPPQQRTAKQKTSVRVYEESPPQHRQEKQRSAVRRYETSKKRYPTKFRSEKYENDSSDISDFDEADYQPTDQEIEDMFNVFESDEPVSLNVTNIKYPLIQEVHPLDIINKINSAGKYESAVDPQANLTINSIRNNILVKLVNAQCSGLYGMGIGRHVVFPSHLVQGVGEIIYLYRVRGLTHSEEYYKVRVSKYKKDWELAAGIICQPNDPAYNITDNPKEQLIFGRQLRSYVPQDITIGSRSLVKFTLQYLPKQGFIIPSMATYVKDYKGTLSKQKVETNIYAMRTMPHLSAQTMPGDCGGAVVQLDVKSSRKLLGMHIGSATAVLERDTTTSYGLVAILTEERVDVLTDNEYTSQGKYQVGLELKFAEPSKYDGFDELFHSESETGEGQHMPPCEDNSMSYLGDMHTRQLPCDLKGRTDHHRTPFYGLFDVKKAPSCLINEQVEDPSQLLLDSRGKPDILVTNLAGYGTKNYSIDNKELEDMTKQLIKYMGKVLADCDITTAKKHKTAMFEAINGQFWNDYFDKINDKTSSGIGWSECPKKDHFLKEITVKNPAATDKSNLYFTAKYIKNTGIPLKLQKVFRTKLMHAKRGFRTMSIWKVCIKDEPLPLLKVKIGKSRIFIAPPMESFLMGRYLFGRWKGAFKSKQFDLFHAVGIDMKSLDVVRLVEKIKTQPNYIDMDYKNFDQRLLAQFMEAAGTVISTVIFERDNDKEMFNARQVYFNEIIYTVMCAYKTVMLTTHGNKSGNPLTTELNCIVNFLYSWYVFRTVTGNKQLEYYMEHVVDINFGDDKVLAVSDEVIDKFNYFSYKDIMSKLGQTITPGNKAGIEIKCTRDLSEISFLKRHFSAFNNDIWFAPLDRDSIEAVFNYCSLDDEEIKEWVVVIQEQLIEAMLHGSVYFKYIAKTLSKFVRFDKNFKLTYPQLRAEINSKISWSFEHYLDLFLTRIGLLAPCGELKDLIYSLNKGSVDQVHALLVNQGEYQNDNNNNIINKQLKICTTKIEDSVMHRSKSSINYPGGNLQNLTTSNGMPFPEEVTPEAANQLEGVQSDIGKPIRISCSQGIVYAFDLSQTDDAYKSMPMTMEKQMSLPNKLKYMQYQDSFSLGVQGTTHKEVPTLAQVNPKALQLMRVFQYHRVNKVLVRVDCRPPMGFSQIVKISSTTSADTTSVSRNRKGVTYNLADNPKMYFIIPFSDREFAKLYDEPWFSLIIEAITGPVSTTTNPSPQSLRYSYEILDMDFYVDRNVRDDPPCPPPPTPVLNTGSLTWMTTGTKPVGNINRIVINDPTYITCTLLHGANGGTIQCTFNVGSTTFAVYNSFGNNVLVQMPSVLLTPGSYTIALTGSSFICNTAATLSWYTLGTAPTLNPFLASIGSYQCDEFCSKPDVDFVSLLKEQADIDQSEVHYEFTDLPSEPHEKVYSVNCQFKDFSISKVGIGKSAPKQCAAAEVYSLYLSSIYSTGSGRYEMEATFDSSSATPSVAMDTRPPVGQAHTQSNLAMDQTLGTVNNNLDITNKLYAPINTYTVTSTTTQVIKLRQHPGNWTSFGQESNAQAEVRPYIFSGPTLCNGIPSYGHYKLTGAGNFQQNFRAVIAQAPVEYTAADVDALSLDEVAQLPRIEYFLHGGEVYFTPQWVNRLPVINHRLTDASNTNGWIVIRILENSLSNLSTSPQVTLWVNSSNISMSLNSAPVTPPPVTV